MVFSDEDKQAIKFFRETKGYPSRRFIKEFPEKGWSRSGLDKLLSKFDSIGSVQRLPGSGRPRSMRTVQNIEAVESLILSQEDLPQTHRSQRQITREVRIDLSSVHCIIKR